MAENRPDKIEIYFDGKLQRTLLVHVACGDNCGRELANYTKQFEEKPAYEVYINGQLYDIGD